MWTIRSLIGQVSAVSADIVGLSAIGEQSRPSVLNYKKHGSKVVASGWWSVILLADQDHSAQLGATSGLTFDNFVRNTEGMEQGVQNCLDGATNGNVTGVTYMDSVLRVVYKSLSLTEQSHFPQDGVRAFDSCFSLGCEGVRRLRNIRLTLDR